MNSPPKDRDSRYSWLAEGNAKQARKRVAAKVLIRDQLGRILLVNPTYKEHWDMPGGMAEANEPPRFAAEREIVEELGVHVAAGALLVLDWIGPHGPWDDQLVFIFDGGTLPGDAINELTIADREISELGFFSASDASRLLRTDVAKRLMHAVDSLATNRTRYTEQRDIDYPD
ncbi:MAG: NUDIX domain-containing protein [Pseudonocardiaceae bacterium]